MHYPLLNSVSGSDDCAVVGRDRSGRECDCEPTPRDVNASVAASPSRSMESLISEGSDAVPHNGATHRHVRGRQLREVT